MEQAPDTQASSTFDSVETPAQKRRRDVRDAIISAAERVFAAEGAAGLSIRRLASEVDYSPGAIYKYFDSKEMLLLELKEAFFERLIENMMKIVEDGQKFSFVSRDCFATYVQTALERPHHYAAAFSDVADPESTENSHKDMQDFQNSTGGQAYSMLKGMVQDGIDQGVVLEGLDPDLVAKSIWASMHGVATLMMTFPSFPNAFPGNTPMNGEEFISFHADMVLRGFEKK